MSQLIDLAKIASVARRRPQMYVRGENGLHVGILERVLNAVCNSRLLPNVKEFRLDFNTPESLRLTFRSRGLAASVAEELLQCEGDLLACIAAWWADVRGQQPNAHMHDEATLLYGLTCAMWLTERFSIRLRVGEFLFENEYAQGCPLSGGRWTRQPHDTSHRIVLQLDANLMPHSRFDFDALSHLPTLLEQPERLETIHLSGPASQLLPAAV
jgi:hypothetical protein